MLTELAFAGPGVPLQRSIDHGIELHESLILSEIILRLAEEAIHLPV
jgi:hypothetical protein